jgi:predicted O-methyltransferase YrrM
MSAQQAQVFSQYFLIDDSKLSDFERFCDLNDRGIGWGRLDRAIYLVRRAIQPHVLELCCTWTFAEASQANAQQVSGLVDAWKKSFAVEPFSPAPDLRRPWSSLHSYFAGGRQDSRSPLLDEVVFNAFVKEPESFAQIREANSKNGLPPIALSPHDGHMLMCLLQMIGAKRGVEVGTLGGYSAAWICQAIGEDGTLVSIEKDAKRSRVAAKNLENLGFADRVECRAGDANQVLKNLESQGLWDFVFIDADKAGYGLYVDWAMCHVRPGGLILADNAYLWGGMSTFPNTYDSVRVDQSLETGTVSRLHGFDAAEYQGMSEAWRRLSMSNDFDTWMLPSPEGLLVSRKKPPSLTT